MDGRKLRVDEARLVHIRFSADEHKRLRIAVASLDTTIQDWVRALVVRELDKKKQVKP
ncbi:MAG: hypothetical protein ACKVU1_00620 [bacterium]